MVAQKKGIWHKVPSISTRGKSGGNFASRLLVPAILFTFAVGGKALSQENRGITAGKPPIEMKEGKLAKQEIMKLAEGVWAEIGRKYPKAVEGKELKIIVLNRHAFSQVESEVEGEGWVKEGEGMGRNPDVYVNGDCNGKAAGLEAGLKSVSLRMLGLEGVDK